MVGAEVDEVSGDDVAQTLETTEAEPMLRRCPAPTPAECAEGALDADDHAGRLQAGDRRATTGGSAPAAFGKR